MQPWLSCWTTCRSCRGGWSRWAFVPVLQQPPLSVSHVGDTPTAPLPPAKCTLSSAAAAGAYASADAARVGPGRGWL